MAKLDHREWSGHCGDVCPTVAPEASKAELGEIMVSIFDNAEAGYGLNTSRGMHYDSDANELVTSEHTAAALKCAQKILAGECAVYAYSGAFSPIGRN